MKHLLVCVPSSCLLPQIGPNVETGTLRLHQYKPETIKIQCIKNNKTRAVLRPLGVVVNYKISLAVESKSKEE
jgi:hypothetical protein